MQPVTKNRAQRIGGVLGRARALVGREVAFGAGIVLLVVFALVTTAVLYANPPGRMSFSFRTDDAPRSTSARTSGWRASAWEPSRTC